MEQFKVIYKEGTGKKSEGLGISDERVNEIKSIATPIVRDGMVEGLPDFSIIQKLTEEIDIKSANELALIIHIASNIFTDETAIVMASFVRNLKPKENDKSKG